MVSSVSRDDAKLAHHSLKMGASDYVEKPTLQNLTQVAEELRSKLNFAFSTRGERVDQVLTSQFARVPIISQCGKKASVWFVQGANLERIRSQLQSLARPQPPNFVVVFDRFELVAPWIQSQAELKASVWQPGDSMFENRLFFVKGEDQKALSEQLGGRRLHVLAVGDVSFDSGHALWSKASVRIVEDLNGFSSKNYDRVRANADVIVPLTSFAYESDRRHAEDET
jgi:chemotaxis protein methyltransferase CheR